MIADLVFFTILFTLWHFIRDPLQQNPLSDWTQAIFGPSSPQARTPHWILACLCLASLLGWASIGITALQSTSPRSAPSQSLPTPMASPSPRVASPSSSTSGGR